MPQHLPYWSPSLEKRWGSIWAVQPDFPNVSLPYFMDMPEIGVYQIYPTEMPEIPEGMTLEWLQVPKLGEDGKYYEDYKFNPIEV